jgi:MFS family permease
MGFDLKTSFFSRLDPRHGKKPIFLSTRSNRIFILFTVAWSVFTVSQTTTYPPHLIITNESQDTFLYGVVVPVIPFALEQRAGVARSDRQHWVSVLLSVYAAGLIFFAPICGYMADWTTSRRGPFLSGLVLLTGSTLMLCFGQSIPVLVIARLLQGASAAIVWVVALALMADTVGEKDIAKATGYVISATSLGVLVSPLIGGAVYERAGYYAVFGVTFAVIGFDIILRLVMVEKKVASRWEEVDATPTPTSTGQEGTELQDKPAAVIEKDNAAATATATPEAAASKKRHVPPILVLLRSRRIMVAIWGNLVGSMTFSAIDATLPLYVNQIFGWNSLGAGLTFLALVVPGFIGPWFGHLTDKYGPRWIAATGMLFSVPFWVLLRFVDHNSTGQAVLLCALLVLLGFALSALLTPLMAEFSKVCDAKIRHEPDIFRGKSAYAQSYGIFNVSWAGGSLLGPLMAGAIKNAAGWRTMTWVMGLWCAVGILPTVWYSGGVLRKGVRPGRQGANEVEV